MAKKQRGMWRRIGAELTFVDLILVVGVLVAFLLLWEADGFWADGSVVGVSALVYGVAATTLIFVDLKRGKVYPYNRFSPGSVRVGATFLMWAALIVAIGVGLLIAYPHHVKFPGFNRDVDGPVIDYVMSVVDFLLLSAAVGLIFWLVWMIAYAILRPLLKIDRDSVKFAPSRAGIAASIVIVVILGYFAFWVIAAMNAYPDARVTGTTRSLAPLFPLLFGSGPQFNAGWQWVTRALTAAPFVVAAIVVISGRRRQRAARAEAATAK